MILKLKNKIEKWRILPLSMVGRNIAIKMLALSRFLYLFQNLPLFLTSKFFKQLDSIILPFLWGYKLPRISKAHLQKPVKEGGFGLPIFKNYYWAANGRALMYWQQAQSAEVPNNSPNGFTLKPQVSEDTWHKALSGIHKCSINVRYRLIYFKVIHRLHFSKLKLHKIYSSVSPLCDRCRGAEGSLFHLFLVVSAAALVLVWSFSMVGCSM